MILIVPPTFHTHCVRVLIQIRANIIIFFINSMYNIKPLIMFRRVSVSLDHHEWITNVKILGALYTVILLLNIFVNNWNTKTIKQKYKCTQLRVLKEAYKPHPTASVVPWWTKSVNVVAVLAGFGQLFLGNSFIVCFLYIQFHLANVVYTLSSFSCYNMMFVVMIVVECSLML
jgi:hypothetical protein